MMLRPSALSCLAIFAAISILALLGDPETLIQKSADDGTEDWASPVNPMVVHHRADEGGTE